MSGARTAPEFLPLHPQSNRQFHELHAADLSADLQRCDKEFNESLEQIIDCADPNTNDLVQTLSKTYERMNQERLANAKLIKKIDILKKDYKLESDKCEPISLENWDSYCNGERRAPSLVDMFTKMKEPRATLPQEGNTSTIKLFKIDVYKRQN